MDGLNADDRFKAVLNDKRFSSIKQRQRKVKIDSRFQSMFTDDRFKLKYEVDKRGKPVHETTSENLKKYYRLSKRDAKKLKDERRRQKQNLCKLLNEEIPIKNETEIKSGDDSVLKVKEGYSDSDESTIDSDSEDDSSDEGVDLARGEGNVESSSDEDEEEYFDDDSKNGFDHQWGEIDADALRSDEISSRLALCNMDWDRVKATDILVLLNSFKPPNGVINKVSIFPSEFGTERLAEEAINGPTEMVNHDEEQKNIREDIEVSDAKEGQRFQVEKLRQYQINRLKYYYAVIECDSVQTADAIYQECDGMEYEMSATKLDLRFIPDSVTFDDSPPKDVSSHIPNKDQYKPASFVTTALNQSKVDLTWDETDRKRLAITMRKFKPEELEDLDLKDFLASSSGSEDEDTEGPPTARIGISSRTTDADQIARYRSLLLGGDEEEDQDEDKPNDVDMEITWDPMPDDKEEKRPEIEESDEPEEREVEQDDTSQGKRGKKRRKKVDEPESDEVVKERAQLELLMMDSEDVDRKHFNMDEIVKQERTSKKKKRRVDVKTKADEDNFQIDISDQRFNAVYTSSEFALDPNNPAFRKTKAMQELIHERQKRLTDSVMQPENISPDANEKESKTENRSTISQLVSSIKAKTRTQFSKKKQKL